MKNIIITLMLLISFESFSQYKKEEHHLRPNDYYALACMVGTFGYFSAISLDQEQRNNPNNTLNGISDDVFIISIATTILVGTFVYMGINNKIKNLEITPVSFIIKF